MNKQKAIEKIKNLNAIETFMSEIIWVKRDDVLDIIKQLDEPVSPPDPKPLEIEKIVVPQFVADWYEDHKDNLEYSIKCLSVHCPDQVRQIDTWFDDDSNKPIETLIMMHKFGYEVEKEKLYTVEIPNPNGGEYSRVYLGKYSSGKVGLYSWTGFTHIAYADDWKNEEKAQLTEAEIKKDFDWAWEFSEEVKE